MTFIINLTSHLSLLRSMAAIGSILRITRPTALCSKQVFTIGNYLIYRPSVILHSQLAQFSTQKPCSSMSDLN